MWIRMKMRIRIWNEMRKDRMWKKEREKVKEKENIVDRLDCSVVIGIVAWKKKKRKNIYVKRMI